MTYATPVTPEAEYALLGAAMTDGQSVIDLLQLRADQFHHAGCRAAFEAIQALAADNGVITPATVATKLREAGTLEDIGGAPFIANLVDCADLPGAGRQHVVSIREAANRRRLLDVAAIMTEQVRSGDATADQVAAWTMEKILNTTGRELDDLVVTPEQATEYMKARAELEAQGATIKWGIQALDDTVKLLPGMLVYVAARPKVGKSSLGFQLLTENGDQTRCGLASYEMQRDQVMQHLMGKLGVDDGIDMYVAKYGPYDGAWPDVNAAACSLDVSMLFHRPNIQTLCAQLTALHRVRPFGLIVVDYVGKVAQATMQEKGNLDLTQQAVAMVSGRLKQLAAELECPVVSMAQISRAGADMPELHHLRDSGALEADADAVVLLHHEKDDEESGAPGRYLFKVPANRMGEPTDWRQLNFMGKYAKFTDPGLRLVQPGYRSLDRGVTGR